jgi:hypothetical protein
VKNEQEGFRPVITIRDSGWVLLKSLKSSMIWKKKAVNWCVVLTQIKEPIKTNVNGF